MKLKISASSLFMKHYMIVDDKGVKFYESSAWGGRRFPFRNIETVLMSPTHVLSFQVGGEVFSIPTKPGDPKHQALINTLVQEVQKAV